MPSCAGSPCTGCSSPRPDRVRAAESGDALGLPLVAIGPPRPPPPIARSMAASRATSRSSTVRAGVPAPALPAHSPPPAWSSPPARRMPQPPPLRTIPTAPKIRGAPVALGTPHRMSPEGRGAPRHRRGPAPSVSWMAGTKRSLLAHCGRRTGVSRGAVGRPDASCRHFWDSICTCKRSRARAHRRSASPGRPWRRERRS